MRQVEPELVCLRGLLPSQIAFSLVETHSHGFVQFLTPPHKHPPKILAVSAASQYSLHLFQVQRQNTSIWVSKGEGVLEEGNLLIKHRRRESKEVQFQNDQYLLLDEHGGAALGDASSQTSTSGQEGRSVPHGLGEHAHTLPFRINTPEECIQQK